MYAVIKTGGKQYRVQEGDVLQVEKLNMEKGKKVAFDKILLIEDKENVLIGTPYIEDALVRAVVIDNFKEKKVIVFKKKRRKQYRKTRGHRQELTQIRIEEILPSKKDKPETKKTEKKEELKEQVDRKEDRERSRVQELTNALESEYLKKPSPKKKTTTKKKTSTKEK